MTARLVATAMCRDCQRRIWLYEGGQWTLADDPAITAHSCAPHIDHEPIRVRPTVRTGGAA